MRQSKRRFRSYADAEQAYERASESETLLLLGLNSMINDKPTAVERVTLGPKDDKQHHTLRLYRPTEAHGGIVVDTYCSPGQRDSSTVRYLEQWWNYRHHATAETRPVYQAIERLMVARNEAGRS